MTTLTAENPTITSSYSKNRLPIVDSSTREQFTKEVVQEIEKVGLVFNLERPLRDALKNLYTGFLQQPSIILAQKDLGVQTVLEEVFKNKISHSLGTVASFSKINKELTGKSLSVITALGLAITVITQIDWVDSISELKRDLLSQKLILEYFNKNLFSDSGTVIDNTLGIINSTSFQSLINGIKTGLFAEYQNALNKLGDTDNNKESFITFIEETINSYSLAVALEHLRTDKEKNVLVNEISLNQNNLLYPNYYYSDSIDAEKIRFENSIKKGDPDYNSFYIESITNGLKYLVATYIFFERKNLPDISNLTDMKELFTLINSSTRNLALLHLCLDDLTDMKEDENKGDRSLFRNKNSEDRVDFLLHAYDDAVYPLRKLGEDNKTIKRLETMINDLVIFFALRSKSQNDQSFIYFDRLMKEKDLRLKFSLTMIRVLFVKYIPKVLSQLSL